MKKSIKKTYGPETKETALYKNTTELLKNYREIKWSIEIAGEELACDIEHRYLMSVGDYLEALYGAGVEQRYDRRIESLVQSAEISVRMLSALHAAVEKIRDKHEKGEEYYYILYYTFLYKSKLSLEQILSCLAAKGYIYEDRTYYRRRTEAVEVLSVVLWGCTAKHLRFSTEQNPNEQK